jgi:hypothetical protein
MTLPPRPPLPVVWRTWPGKHGLIIEFEGDQAKPKIVTLSEGSSPSPWFVAGAAAVVALLLYGILLTAVLG